MAQKTSAWLMRRLCNWQNWGTTNADCITKWGTSDDTESTAAMMSWNLKKNNAKRWVRNSVFFEGLTPKKHFLISCPSRGHWKGYQSSRQPDQWRCRFKLARLQLSTSLWDKFVQSLSSCRANFIPQQTAWTVDECNWLRISTQNPPKVRLNNWEWSWSQAKKKRKRKKQGQWKRQVGKMK